MKINKYLLGLSVFVCGAVLMIVELVGTRVMAPYLGASIYVWSSIIGVILGSLSLGYWLGGKIADQKPGLQSFALIIFFSGLLILLIPFVDEMLLEAIARDFNIKIGAILGSLLLFALPSTLLGMVSPYAVKLKLTDIKNTGSSVGNLYAISTLGSIVGTFLAGFVLLSLYGNQKILVMSALVLIFLAFYVYTQKYTFLIISILILAIYSYGGPSLGKVGAIVDKDTAYNRAIVFDTYSEYGKIRVLTTSVTDWQSAMYINGSKDPVFEYSRYYRLADYFNPNIKTALMIGGGGYSTPKDYLAKHKNSTMDVVEIDEGITKIAEEYFELKKGKRLNIYNEDARTFIDKSNKKYDAIYVDAYRSSEAMPFYLTTVEMVQKLSDRLNSNGVVVANVISSLTGDKSKFLQAEYVTYKKIFPQVYIFPATKTPLKEKQNLVLVAMKGKTKPSFVSDNPEYSNYLKSLWTGKIDQTTPVLTDDYAPVDKYLSALQ